MAGVEIKMDLQGIKKVNRLARGTGVVFTRFSKSEGRKAFNQHKPALVKDLQTYVKKRPGQRYKRTFTLKRKWRVAIKILATGFSAITTNATPYTHHVVGKPDLRTKAGGKGQAWMHKGRWWIAGGVTKKHYDKMQNTYEKNMVDRLEDQTGFEVQRRSKLIK
jgi:hypothetical protein